MADSTANIDQIATAQAQKEVTANENFAAASPSMFGARRASTCLGLTWGYYGGRWGGSLVANGTLELPTGSTCYIIANRETGVVSLDQSSPPDWDSTVDYGRLYKVLTGIDSVTSWEDHRGGPGGFFATAASGALVGADDVLVADDGGYFGAPPVTVESALQQLGATAAPTTMLAAVQVSASDLTTPITSGTRKAYFRMPHAMTLTAVRASLDTAQTSGSLFTVDVNEGGATILSTKLTIDNTEKTSTTAVTAAVMSDVNLADDAEISVDVDQVGDGTAKGLIVTLIGTRPI